MKHRILTALLATIAVSLFTAGRPVSSASFATKAADENVRTGRLDPVIIECPASVATGVRDVPQGWLDSNARRIQFVKASVIASGSVRLINCDYAQGGTEASLTREVPKGYDCEVTGGKRIECKPMKIKIPGKKGT